MKPWQKALSWLVAALVPLVLILSGLRLLLTPLFLQLEYRMPGFPEDSYGFTRADRLRWAPLALDYLLNDSGIRFLSDLRFDSGEPLFNERELSHMIDVKILTQKVLLVWYGVLGALALLGGLAWRGGGGWFRRGAGRGGWLTVGLVAAVLLAVAISFWDFFTVFHQMFFEGDSWLFYYSDTLIRLFPLRFWSDAFIFTGLISLGGAAALIVWARRGAHNRPGV